MILYNLLSLERENEKKSDVVDSKQKIGYIIFLSKKKNMSAHMIHHAGLNLDDDDDDDDENFEWKIFPCLCNFLHHHLWTS